MIFYSTWKTPNRLDFGWLFKGARSRKRAQGHSYIKNVESCLDVWLHHCRSWWLWPWLNYWRPDVCSNQLPSISLQIHPHTVLDVPPKPFQALVQLCSFSLEMGPIQASKKKERTKRNTSFVLHFTSSTNKQEFMTFRAASFPECQVNFCSCALDVGGWSLCRCLHTIYFLFAFSNSHLQSPAPLSGQMNS